MPPRRSLTVILLLTALLSDASRVHADPLDQGGHPTVHGSGGDLVVLVHGLGRTRLSMLSLERALEADGYEVVNWGYSSFCCRISELSNRLSRALASHGSESSPRVHFVGHSLGNIIVRALLATHPPPNLGRVVMLAPPNRGSPIADRYVRHLGWLLKPLSELTTGPTSTVNGLRLPPLVEVGVIAGRDDGKVPLEASHLPGETDHVVVPSAHTFIMNRRDVRQLITTFLETGSFALPG